MKPDSNPTPQLHRVAETHRRPIGFFINGVPSQALSGDTLLTALLTNGCKLRNSEFGDGPRAGFCNMGACQDCWVSLEQGARLRACSEFVSEGMRVVTE